MSMERGDTILKFVVVKTVKEKEEYYSDVLIVTNTEHDAYLHLLMEAEDYYDYHDVVKDTRVHKIFYHAKSDTTIEMTIQKTREIAS